MIPIAINAIIVWSNDNQGFLDACFSCLALLLSVVSVVIAIKAIRTPYCKKLQLKVVIGNLFTTANPLVDHPYISISVVNIGNRAVNLIDLCLYCNGLRMVNTEMLARLNGPLLPTNILEAKFIDYHDEFLTSAKHNRDRLYGRKWYGYAKDSEGGIYKKRSKEIDKEFDRIFRLFCN